MKENKNNKKLLIIIISIVAIVMISVLVIILLKNDTNKEEKNKKGYEDKQIIIYETEYDCTKKGNICIIDEIAKGIKTTIQVSEDTTEDFYLISNTEDKLVFISDKTFSDTVYSTGIYNFFGPRTLIEKVYDSTKDWNMVNALKSEYTDHGQDKYNEMCESYETVRDDEYDCRLGVNGIGFKYIKYGDGIEYEDGFGNIVNVGEGNIYARPATLEDINPLLNQAQTVEWIANSEDFWLIDSDTQLESGITMGAKYVLPSSESSFGFYINFDYLDAKHGYKVVIELDKEA